MKDHQDFSLLRVLHGLIGGNMHTPLTLSQASCALLLEPYFALLSLPGGSVSYAEEQLGGDSPYFHILILFLPQSILRTITNTSFDA